MTATGTTGRLLTVVEVEEVLRVSARTVWRLIRAGTLPVVRIGGRTLVDPADLEALIDASRSTAPRAP